MALYDHARFKIAQKSQHPFNHTLEEFLFAHPALPSGSLNLSDALSYILEVLYPRIAEQVATPADLPTGVDTPNVGDVAPTLYDQRVVSDDGDGKAAIYMFYKMDGQPTAQWNKVGDLDYGVNAVISGLIDQTQYLFVRKLGSTDFDPVTELPLTGIDAGQHIYGGTEPNQNLTLHPTNGDDPATNTGWVQINGEFRPYADLTFSSGTASERWLNIYAGSGVFGTGTMTITSDALSGSITDTSGQISFDDENLLTTGNVNATNVTASSNLFVDDAVNTLTIGASSIVSDTGAISFASNDLSTGGSIAALDALFGGTLSISSGSIIDSGGIIGFGATDLSTTGDITAETAIFGRVEIDDIIIDGDTISTAAGAAAPQNFESYDLATWPIFNAGPRSFDGPIANVRLATRFVPAASAPLTGFSIYALPRTSSFATVSDGELQAELYTGDTLNPITLVATSTNTIDSSVWSGETFSTVSEKVFNFASVPLTAGTNYWVSIRVINSTESSNSNIMALGTTTGAPVLYTNRQSNNGGVSWNDTIGSQPIYYTWTYQAAGAANVVIDPAGVINLNKSVFGFDTTLTGTLAVTGQAIIDNLTFDGRTVSSDNGQITTDSLIPDGGGRILGNSLNQWSQIHINGTLFSDGGNRDFLSTDLFALDRNVYRDVAKTQPAQDGDVLFYNSAFGRWLASAPDPEIDHGSLSGLAGDDHVQYLNVNGRAGGQTVLGSSDGFGNLTVRAHGSSVSGYQFSSGAIVPVAFSVKPSLGLATNEWNNLYMEGQAYGMRLENTADPSSLYDAADVGRAAFNTADGFVYINDGSSFKRVGNNSYNNTHTHVELALPIDVSGSVEDARNCIWQLCDIASNEEIMSVPIQKTETEVTIANTVPLSPGSYRLIGIQV